MYIHSVCVDFCSQLYGLDLKYDLKGDFKMEIGMSVFAGVSIEKTGECLKKVGVNRTFILSEFNDFDNVMKLFSENGIR